jgi:hypothetical protein
MASPIRSDKSGLRLSGRMNQPIATWVMVVLVIRLLGFAVSQKGHPEGSMGQLAP